MSVQLILGDCREILPTLDRATIGAVVFDPPYGVEWNSGWTPTGSVIANDGDTVVRDHVLAWANRLSIACWSSWKYPPAGAKARIVWDKGDSVGMGDLSFPWRASTEDCYLFGEWVGERRGGVLRASGHNFRNGGTSHPHEKPLDVLARIIETAPPGIILDPTCGSGSTLLAARNMGRDAIGIEIDERWFKIAQQRCAQGNLFG